MGLRNAFYLIAFFLFRSLFVTDIVTAQTIAYRQTNLASNVPNVANNIVPRLVNPFGIAFLSGQPFVISENNGGRVTVHDATGLSAGPATFTLPNAAHTGFDAPTGIVADQNSAFGGISLLKAFIVVTDLTLRTAGRLRNSRVRLLTATAVAAILTLGFAIAGCGGYGSSAQANRGTASITVTAQSGNISHMTTIRVTVQ